MVWRGGRVQSCVRPVGAVHMTAGLDGMQDKVPFCLSGCDALDICRVVLIPSLTGSPSHRIVLATSGLVFAWLFRQTGVATPAGIR
jgi:hypothetical protein